MFDVICEDVSVALVDTGVVCEDAKFDVICKNVGVSFEVTGVE